MRGIVATIVFSAAFLGHWPAQAQGAGRPQPPRNDIRDEVGIARLMDRLREEMWAYRQELDGFRGAPKYGRLVDLRHALRGQARRAQREVALAMKQTAGELKRLTGELVDLTDGAAREGVRRRGDRLKARADRIEEMIDRPARLTRED